MKVNQFDVGDWFEYQGNYFEVIETEHLHQGRGKATVSLGLRNVLTGQTLSKTFRADDVLPEVETEELSLKYRYRDRTQVYFLTETGEQHTFDQRLLGDKAEFIKADLPLRGIFVKGKLVQVKLPVKAEYRVVEAPPGLKGNTVQASTKIVTLETGAKIKAPLFVNAGDVVVVNLEKREYVERA